ncbi:MAG: PQQ-dependent sugar dehydrogenase [Sandaracinaceae bacterium]
MNKHALLAVLVAAGAGTGCGGGGMVPPDGGDGGGGAILAFEQIEVDEGEFVAFSFLPGTTDELLLGLQSGEIVHYRLDGTTTERLGSFFVPELREITDCGLLAIEADPDWPTNRFVWASHCGADLESKVTRLTFDGESYDGVDETASVILSIEEPDSTNPRIHSISNILFEDDGTMVLGLGDKSFRDNGQDFRSTKASILRIVPNRDPDGDGYTIPEDNPFADGVDGAPELLAKGLRNPFRIAFGPEGRVWIADIGEVDFEEINLLGDPVMNFGWPRCEANRCRMSVQDHVRPITSWPRNENHPYFEDDPDTEPTNRRSSWIGEAYQGGSNDRYAGELDGLVGFGDLCLGWVRGISADAEGEIEVDRFLGHLPFIVNWRQGPDGYLYATTFNSCDSARPIQPAAFWRVVLADDD